VITPTGTAKVRLELTAIQSADIPLGPKRFMTFATLVNTHTVTLVNSHWDSIGRVTKH
jgi:hypothetical protein